MDNNRFRWESMGFYINYEECKLESFGEAEGNKISFILTMRNVNWEDLKPVDKPVDVLY